MTFEDKIERGSFTGATANDVVEVSLPSMSAAMVQLTGTFTATVTFEVLVDEGSSPTWKAIPATNVTTGASATTATAAGIYQIAVPAARRCRARCSAFTSGPVTVAVNVSRGAPSTPASVGGSTAVTEADGANVALGTTTDAGIITDVNGTAIGFLRGAIKMWITYLARIPAALTGSGNFKVSLQESNASQTVAGAKTNNNAAPGATNAGVLSSVANAAVPTWTEGNQVAQSVDLSGFQRGIVQGISASGATAVGVNPVVVGMNGAGALIRFLSEANAVAATSGNALLGVGPLVFDTTNWQKLAGDTSGRQYVVGPAAAGAAVAGNPLLLGVSDATNVQTWRQGQATNAAIAPTGYPGAVVMGNNNGGNLATVNALAPIEGIGANNNALVTIGLGYAWNLTNFDRVRNNLEVSIHGSAATGTGTVNTDIVTYNARYLVIRADVTNYNGTGTLLLKAQTQDANGIFVDIPGATTGALTTGQSVSLTVGPNTWPANASPVFYANQVVPRLVRIVSTVGVATVTFSSSYTLAAA